MRIGVLDPYFIFEKYIENEEEQLEKYETEHEMRRNMRLKPNAPEEAKEAFEKWKKEEDKFEAEGLVV